jgi:hypothetical protein
MDVVGFILLVFNFVNLIILLPIIYPVLGVVSNMCWCAVTPEFVYIFVYIIFTIGLLIVTILTNMKFITYLNRRTRVLSVVYFLMTLVFVETATRYINQQTSRDDQNDDQTCACVDTHYEQWMTYIVYIRWISVYFFSVILISAGLYLFVRSERQPFSFPGTRRL